MTQNRAGPGHDWAWRERLPLESVTLLKVLNYTHNIQQVIAHRAWVQLRNYIPSLLPYFLITTTQVGTLSTTKPRVHYEDGEAGILPWPGKGPLLYGTQTLKSGLSITTPLMFMNFPSSWAVQREPPVAPAHCSGSYSGQCQQIANE
jgi:hypothetical protein